MPREVLRELISRAPDLRLWNFYGQTEMASLATALPPEEQFTHGGSAGYPALNVETRIVDDADRDVPAGEVGEIVHRRSEEHTSELQSLMRTSYAVFCLKKKK